MANIKSAKKRIRQIERHTTANRSRTSAMRTSVKNVQLAIEGGDSTAAKDALKTAQPLVMRDAQKGGLHRNTASRMLSRMSARIKAMEA